MRQGRASSVSDLGDGTVLRVGGRPRAEAALMDVARSHGVAVPAVREVRDDALVLERITGPSLSISLRRRPWSAADAVRTLLDLHEAIHRISLDGGRLVHFDLHPDNVLLGPRGPVLIDWTNAHAGRPEADVALTWLILHTSAGLPGRLLARLFARQVGRPVIRAGLPEAVAFRTADPHVTAAEREAARRASP